MAQWEKNPPIMQETWEMQVQSLGREDSLKKDMATHSSIRAWKIPWPEKPGKLYSMGSQELGTTEQLNSSRRVPTLVPRKTWTVIEI